MMAGFAACGGVPRRFGGHVVIIVPDPPNPEPEEPTPEPDEPWPPDPNPA